MAVNVKLVALDKLQAASIPSHQSLMKIGERARAALAAYSAVFAQLRR